MLLVIFVIINASLWMWVEPAIIAAASTLVSTVLWLLIVNFFRSPRRTFIGDTANAVVSSADGKVVAIEEVYEPEYLKTRCIQLSVFMSILNVHANWFPVNGEVVYTRHHKGRFLAAYLPKSSTENERSTIAIRTPQGQTVLVRQIAGAMAKRIVTYAHPGIEASIEDHLGFIKFGSRVDIFLPLGTDILAKIGDKPIGGISQVATLHPNDTVNA